MTSPSYIEWVEKSIDQQNEKSNRIKELKKPITVWEAADRIEQLEKHCVVYAKTDRMRTDHINKLEAKLDKALAALSACVLILDATVKESGRSIEWGEEDPFRRGEWFEDEDLAQIEFARAQLKDLGANLDD